MSTIFCSVCGQKVLRSKIAEHNAMEHSRGVLATNVAPPQSIASTSFDIPSNPISDITKLLLFQMEENKKLKEQEKENIKRPSKRSRSQVSTNIDTEDKPAKKQKGSRYDYHKFCVNHVSPGECIVNHCQSMGEYIMATASPQMHQFCQHHTSLPECFMYDCVKLRAWFVEQLEPRDQEDPEVGELTQL